MGLIEQSAFRKKETHAKRGFALFCCGLLLLIGPTPIFTSQAESVTLAWDPNSEPDLAGYKFYYGGQTRSYTNVVDVSKVTTNTVTGLAQGETYFFAVTAYNTSGLESDVSKESAAWLSAGA